MAELRLQAMTAEFYEPWIKTLMAGYAQDNIDAGEWSAEEASSRVAADTARLLPDGLQSPGQLLFTAHNSDDEIVGAIWIGLNRPNNGAWVYEIEVLETHRGGGYGRALLAAGEHEAR